ncbi:MAG: hypothetical protein ACRDRW_08750 [Pseudonocardiaceae bacterium]
MVASYPPAQLVPRVMVRAGITPGQAELLRRLGGVVTVAAV